MPPKAGKGKTTKKKSSKPEWMSEDVWAVSLDLPLLFNSFAGIKSDKPAKSGKSDKAATPGKTDKPATPGKAAGKGGKPEPPPPIPKAQVIQPFMCSTTSLYTLAQELRYPVAASCSISDRHMCFHISDKNIKALLNA